MEISLDGRPITFVDSIAIEPEQVRERTAAMGRGHYEASFAIRLTGEQYRRFVRMFGRHRPPYLSPTEREALRRLRRGAIGRAWVALPNRLRRAMRRLARHRLCEVLPRRYWTWSPRAPQRPIRLARLTDYGRAVARRMR